MRRRNGWVSSSTAKTNVEIRFNKSCGTFKLHGSCSPISRTSQQEEAMCARKYTIQSAATTVDFRLLQPSFVIHRGRLKNHTHGWMLRRKAKIVFPVSQKLPVLDETIDRGSCVRRIVDVRMIRRRKRCMTFSLFHRDVMDSTASAWAHRPLKHVARLQASQAQLQGKVRVPPSREFLTNFTRIFLSSFPFAWSQQNPVFLIILFLTNTSCAKKRAARSFRASESADKQVKTISADERESRKNWLSLKLQYCDRLF